MKVMIKGKVWLLPDGQLSAHNDDKHYVGCVKRPLRHTLEMIVPIDCCTEKLATYFRKKFDRNKKIKMTVLMGVSQEMSVVGAIMSLSTSYQMGAVPSYAIGIELTEVPVFTERIDWDDVQNAR